MIEFKADCGHMIEVAERDAGKIVKCAYCGREVEAPRRDPSDSAILLREVDLSELAKGEGATGTPAGITIQGRQRKAKAAPGPEDAGPAGRSAARVALAAGFGLICLTVFVMVTRSLVNFAKDPARILTPDQTHVANSPGTEADLPAISERRLPDTTSISATVNSPTTHASSGASSVAKKRGRRSHTFESHDEGLFIETFIPSARVYVRSLPSDNESRLGSDESEFVGPGSQKIVLSRGEYQVAVAVDLQDPALQRFPGLEDMRSRSQADLAAPQDYLALDLSNRTELLNGAASPCIVRHYDVRVEPGQWTLVTSLFVPGRTAGDILALLPGAIQYDFDRDEAAAGINQKGVSRASDHTALLELLARAGQTVFIDSGGNNVVFEVDVRDGSFRSYLLPDEHRDEVAATASPSPIQAAGAGSPWGPRRSNPPPSQDKSSKPADLQQVLADLQQKAQHGDPLAATEWLPYWRSGALHAMWRSAEVKTRVALVRLINDQTAGSLVQEAGATMLADPDLDVRLALLDVLVRSASGAALPSIEQRLLDLEKDTTLSPAETQTEKNALQDARAKLGGPPAGKKRNPWER